MNQYLIFVLILTLAVFSNISILQPDYAQAGALVDSVSIPVGTGEKMISFTKNAQDGGLGLSSFFVYKEKIVMLDNGDHKILVYTTDGKFESVIHLDKDTHYTDIYPDTEKNDGSFYVLSTPPALTYIDKNGKSDTQKLKFLNSATAVFKSPYGLTGVLDSTSNVIVLYKKKELKKAFGYFFEPSICLTSDSRIPQPGEKFNRGTDILLLDPYKLRKNEVIGKVFPFFKKSKILSVNIAGVDKDDRIIVSCFELLGGERFISLSRINNRGLIDGKLFMKEMRKPPVPFYRDFFLSDDGYIYTYSCSKNVREFKILKLKIKDLD